MKVDKTELIYKLVEVVNDLSEKSDPAEELISMGNALAKIGRTLRGIKRNEAVALIMTIKTMNDGGLLDLPSRKEESQASGRKE